MNKYTLQINTTTAGIPWTYEFHMASDQMALDYAHKIVANDFPGVRWFMSLTVWKHSPREHSAPDDNGPVVLGTISLNPATTRCTRDLT